MIGQVARWGHNALLIAMAFLTIAVIFLAR
jgi:hypothetical protein